MEWMRRSPPASKTRARSKKLTSIHKISKYLKSFTVISEEDYLAICMRYKIDPDDELILELIMEKWMYFYEDRCYIKDIT